MKFLSGEVFYFVDGNPNRRSGKFEDLQFVAGLKRILNFQDEVFVS